MNRINKCLLKKKKNILSIYFTAGFPVLNDTLRIIKALEKHGADMIEIGMPFSDPVADGPVIQKSSKKALENGMSLEILFEQLKDLRDLTDMPVILMGYLNPVYKMGMEKFLEKCSEVQIDGVILPDLPAEVYEKEYLELFRDREIHNILLITPQTPHERIIKLSNLSDGFLYMVSSYSTTGVVDGFGDRQIEYFKRIKSMELPTPALIGFGISDHKTFDIAGKYAAGAIIGTAFIKAIVQEGSMDEKVKNFIKKIKDK
jgi:tryptophan synthase alpha chain